MSYDIGQAQAQNAYPTALGQSAPRSPLREQMDQIAKTLSGAHSAMDDIEDRILGNRPRPVPPGSPEVEAMPGVADQAERITNRANSLHERLIKLMNSL